MTGTRDVRATVIACATVIEELAPLLPAGVTTQVLDFGLHTRPAMLRETLQAAIDDATDMDVVLLGYGLCSRAVVGITATDVTLVLPKVHDCIGLFLGGHRAYTDQVAREPGTYYLTKGWIAVGDSPFEQVKRLAEKYGPAKARRMVDLMLRHYTRLAFIDTGTDTDTGADGLDSYRDYARRTAQEFGLRFDEVAGAPDLLRRLVAGPWRDDDLVVVPPGGTITDDLFAARPAGPPCA
jgi:hypothetical protein